MGRRITAIKTADIVDLRDQVTLRRIYAEEVNRVRQLIKVSFNRYLNEANFNEGTLCLKAESRLADMLGLNAPQHHTAMILHKVEVRHETSTDKLRAAIDRIRGLPPPTSEDGEVIDVESSSS